MKSALAGMAAVVMLLLAAFVGLRSVYSTAFDAGRLHERNTAREAADQARREDIRLAGQLASTARQEATAARDQAATLAQELAHVRRRLVILPAHCTGSAAVRSPAGLLGAAHAADVDDGDPARRGPDAAAAQLLPELPGRAAGRLPLTADAVRLWNAALTGEQPGRGACGAADATPGACATDSGIDVDDAWANHIENATRCRIDRANHRALIEFLQRRTAQDTTP